MPDAAPGSEIPLLDAQPTAPRVSRDERRRRRAERLGLVPDPTPEDEPAPAIDEPELSAAQRRRAGRPLSETKLPSGPAVTPRYALRVALDLRMAGADRATVEERLRTLYGFADPAGTLDAVFGRGA